MGSSRSSGPGTASPRSSSSSRAGRDRAPGNRVSGDGTAVIDLLSCVIRARESRPTGRSPRGWLAPGSPPPCEPVLSTAVGAIAQAGRDAAAYLYGSVATGQARRARSDVDLLT